jgi:hypothetical protein
MVLYLRVGGVGDMGFIWYGWTMSTWGIEIPAFSEWVTGFSYLFLDRVSAD